MAALEEAFSRFDVETRKGMDLAVRGGAAEMHEYMVYRAPEKTGRLENNFIVTMDAPALFSTPGHASKASAILEQQERIARVGFGDTIYFTNSVTYAPPFESGMQRGRSGDHTGMMANSITRFWIGAEYAVRKGDWR